MAQCAKAVNELSFPLGRLPTLSVAVERRRMGHDGLDEKHFPKGAMHMGFLHALDSLVPFGVSRIASERSIQDTERTPYGEVRYLHLRVCGADLPLGELDPLFTDVSGESFERARDSTLECQRLGFLRQAQHFLLLMDCEKLVRKEKRWEVAHDSMTLLRSCLDSGMLASNSLINVLWTKCDYFEAVKSPENAQFLIQLRGEIEKEFGARVGRLSFTEVAARPTQVATLKFGQGLAELLKYWLSSSPHDRAMNLLPPTTQGNRESELFASRHFPASDEPE